MRRPRSIRSFLSSSYQRILLSCPSSLLVEDLNHPHGVLSSWSPSSSSPLLFLIRQKNKSWGQNPILFLSLQAVVEDLRDPDADERAVVLHHQVTLLHVLSFVKSSLSFASGNLCLFCPMKTSLGTTGHDPHDSHSSSINTLIRLTGVKNMRMTTGAKEATRTEIRSTPASPPPPLFIVSLIPVFRLIGMGRFSSSQHILLYLNSCYLMLKIIDVNIVDDGRGWCSWWLFWRIMI